MAEGSRLPGAPTDDEQRIVCHVDVDCFYAACERRREPALEGEPVVVGMGYEDGDDTGAVATASYEAREYGVESAMAISQALELLPRTADAREDPDLDSEDAGHYRPVDMDYYESVSEEVMAALEECADTLRKVSVDEAYLDVTERTAWEVAEGFGRHVKGRVERAADVTASVGIAPTMSAAKIASDHDKPDGIVVVEPDDLREFLAPLPVEEIHGVGPVRARKLREMGIHTAGDLAGADPAELRDEFGERGRELHERARGNDDREVEPRGRPKSLSRESAFHDPAEDFAAVRERALRLADAVADRAERKGALYRTVGVKVVTPPFDVNTRERSLPGPVEDAELLESTALDLLGEFEGMTVRKVGVRVSNLSFADADQAKLGGFEGSGGETAEGRDGGAKDRDVETDRADDPGDDRSGQTSFADFRS